MKKNYLKLISSFLLIFLFITGCRKEIKDKAVTSEAELSLKSGHGEGNNECRLIFATNTDPSGSQDHTFHYNNKGLADEWDIANYGNFKQEYDADGKLKKSILTQNGVVTGITYFFYKGGDKVAKEVSYSGAGTDTTEIVYYHYNAQDNLVKVQSFRNDWVALAKYTPEGNLSASDLFFGGIPVYSAFYTYSKHFKNPYLAVPGIDHAYPYYTPADFFYRKWLYTSEKQVGYDENGNPIISFEYDPSKTVSQAEPHNYPSSATYFDLLGAGWFTYRYEFENCSKGGDNNENTSEMAAQPAAHSAGKINLMLLLIRNPAKSMKEQVNDFRQQCKISKISSINN